MSLRILNVERRGHDGVLRKIAERQNCLSIL